MFKVAESHFVETFYKKVSLKFKVTLTHISLASFLWDIGKQPRPRSGAGNGASDQYVLLEFI